MGLKKRFPKREILQEERTVRCSITDTEKHGVGAGFLAGVWWVRERYQVTVDLLTVLSRELRMTGSKSVSVVRVSDTCHWYVSVILVSDTCQWCVSVIRVWYVSVVHVSDTCQWYVLLVRVSGTCQWYVSGTCQWCMLVIHVSGTCQWYLSPVHVCGTCQ